MAHISSPEENEALIKRVRRIAGQVEALERAITNQAECGDILHLAAATRGAMNGLLDEVLEAHRTKRASTAPKKSCKPSNGTRNERRTFPRDRRPHVRSARP
jgi:FrmR/RcnR family transcriptional regulator, repressor of frmRAB operon